MRRPSALAIVVVAFVLLVAAWVVVNTEWGEVEIPTPLRGDAATNPFYAAQKLVETLGAMSERRESLGETRADAVVVLSTWGWDIDQARRVELERWVERGGRLVVDAALISGTDAFERWSGIARQREEFDPAEEDPFQAPEIFEPCDRFVAVHYDAEGEFEESDDYELCAFDRASWLEATDSSRMDDWLWSLERDEDGAVHGLRVTVGAGTVTVLNGVPFVFRELFDGDHGELLAAAADLRAGDHVVFMSEADVASLLELVWRHGAPVVASLLLFIVLALWRGAMRFGPLVAPSERVRRSLAEQILGTGRFAVRVGGGTALVAAARRALHEAAMRRIIGYERLTGSAQAEAVAKLAGVDARELAAAFDAAQSARPLELRAKLALLEVARRELVSRSHWSQHAKRI
jgi:hypothetical protein